MNFEFWILKILICFCVLYYFERLNFESCVWYISNVKLFCFDLKLCFGKVAQIVLRAVLKRFKRVLRAVFDIFRTFVCLMCLELCLDKVAQIVFRAVLRVCLEPCLEVQTSAWDCVERVFRAVLNECWACVELCLEVQTDGRGHIFKHCFQPINKVYFYMLSWVSRVSTVIKMF